MSRPRTFTEQPLAVEVDRREDAAIVRLRGSADMDVSPRLRDELLTLASERVPQIILDMTELQFICSVGLGEIVAAHSRCRHHDGVIKIVAPQPHIADVLEKTKLTRLFSIFDSVDEALAG